MKYFPVIIILLFLVALAHGQPTIPSTPSVSTLTVDEDGRLVHPTTLILPDGKTLDLSEGTLIFPAGVQALLDLADTALQPGDDLPWSDLTSVPNFATRWPTWSEVTSKPNFATVATSGDYGDLSSTPTLGTMSAESADDYVPIAPRLLTDSAADESLDWQNRRLHVGEVYTVDWGQSRLIGVAPGDIRVDWLDRYLYGHWELVGTLDVHDLNITGNLNIPPGSIQPADLAPDALGAIPAGLTVTSQSSSYTWSPEANGDTLRLTTTGDVTLTLSNMQARPATVTVILIQDGSGNREIIWGGTNIRAPGGIMPTRTSTANSRDIYQFLWDGSRYHLINFLADLQDL